MGEWAKMEFGREELPRRCYLIAGGTPRGVVDSMLAEYGESIVRHHDVYERCLVRDGDEETVLAFQLYGAPIVADFLYVLHDGGTSEVIFLGLAYGKAVDLKVGDYVIPTRTQCMDGVSQLLGAGEYTQPDPELTRDVVCALDAAGLSARQGPTVSVPSTFWHADETLHAQDTIALECEFAGTCYCGAKLGLKVAGVFVISDTAKQDMLDESRIPRQPRVVEAFNAIKKYFKRREI